MPPNSAKLLRAHLREHNISVLAASGAATVVAALGWGFIYGMCYWVAVISVGVKHDMEARPESFNSHFLMVAGGAIGVAVIDAWWHPIEEAQDERGKLSQLYELVLFFPRITVATFQNLTAWAHLPSGALPYAVKLLGRLRHEKTIPLHELPLDIPNLRVRRRVLAVLEVTQLTDIRTEHGQLILRWSALAPEEFRGHQISTEAPEMRRAQGHEVEEQRFLPGPSDHPALGDRPALDDRYEL